MDASQQQSRSFDPCRELLVAQLQPARKAAVGEREHRLL
jgi:hypothetical protein